ncbi:uncharacterized protein N7459_003551 [Penicillium hispanicum]|uniref:uncharacterized protein n=1 Tax=Penicillium hispanicum TaxID=1080232 RepID=UPI0025405A76|nr:uncharacterized protein N7459_003551 [Penicillium hispanicum]KAJ5587786.1 hypothetical protein N7459_003551 [Penicillium hispanicum]
MSTGPHQHPSISVALAITPSHFSSDNPHPNPTITLTAISDYPKPITIFTYNTIFHLDLSLYRSDFTCQDTTGTDTPRSMNIDVSKGPRRPAFSRESGGPDDEYFVTLEPNTPFEFQHAFWLVDGEEAPSTFLPGHRYLLGAKEGAQVRWWQTGRKDDVMAPPGTKSLLGSAAGEPIPLNIGRVEFECV